jgi:TPR repeat protein
VILLTLYGHSAFARSEFTEAYDAAQAGNHTKAIQLWSKLANQGDPESQYTLGWIFESGQGVTQDIEKAVYWYQKAAELNNVPAQFVLATIYDKGIGLPKNPEIAITWYLKAANQGDAEAQFQLGLHHQQGRGVEKNETTSLSWYQKAAQQGHLTAQINLGKIYQSGKGIKKNNSIAIEWYEKAAQQNNALAQYQLARMHELGRGVPPNNILALQLYLKSANKNFAPAAYKVAEFHELGQTGKVDFQAAVKWYTTAAMKGNNAAQFKLGTLYQHGQGVQKNIRTAIDWYQQAAQQNYAQAYYQLGLIYEHGEQEIKINTAQAFNYYEKSSALGNSHAHSRLGNFYENGIGVEEDLNQATELYRQSSETWAKERLRVLTKHYECINNATTKLFSVAIACTNREILSQKIKDQQISVINENSNNWSDKYFTGAIIKGSSELEVTYTRENYFASAQYTFIGREDVNLISRIKNKLALRYGPPDIQNGEVEKGKVSFYWLLKDKVELTAHRQWPNTTTYVTYSHPEHILLKKQQMLISANKMDSIDRLSQQTNTNSNDIPLF